MAARVEEAFLTPSRPRATACQAPRRRRRLAGLAALAAGCVLAAARVAQPARGFAGAGKLVAARTLHLALRVVGSEAEIREEVSKLRAREIKRELEALGVNSADAFEKEELAERLVQARLRGDAPAAEEAAAPAEEAAGATAAEAPAAEAPPAAGGAEEADAVPQEILERCQSMRVKELRTELGSRGIAWADALEKEELVQRLAGVLAQEADFSHSSRLRPGGVGELTGVELMQELEPSATPLLLDVYATWCGPCQMMAPQLEAAARRLGANARVAKMDSDKEPDMASQLRVGALPTVIVFDRSGKEVGRQEGALMEQQLVEMVQSAGR